MPDALDFVSTLNVKVNGQDLADDQLDLISLVTVELNLHLPAACGIHLQDVGTGLTDQNILPIGSEVEISMGRATAPKRVFNGEIVSHSLDMPYGGTPTLIVRGLDRAHRLQRGRSSRSFLNMTDSDIATKVARESGLRPDVDATTQVFSYVLQNNQTNWEFLRDRARRIGYELFVEGSTLHFCKPRVDESAALGADVWSDVVRIHLHMTSVGQVKEVMVRGWDPGSKQPIVGSATHGAATARGGRQQSGAEISSPFGSARMVVTSVPVQSQAEADTLAQALADDLTGNAIRVDAEMMGNPDVRPGLVVNLEALGERFAGRYYVTSVKHSMGVGKPYHTVLTVSGRRDGSLIESFGGAGGRNGHAVDGSIAIGVVTNNKDDQGLGRVKVKLPWISDDETDWARVVSPGAGSDRGLYWLPEVNDEVLVAFELGDPRRPYVLGGLWNNRDKPPKPNTEVVDGGGNVVQRIIKSRSGHTVTFDDSSDAGSITIKDSSGNNVITIETSSNKITLSARGDLELKAGGTVKVTGATVSVEAQGNCDIKANGNAKLSGAALSVEAQATCDIKGAMINLN